eukprot:s741_g2.t3
MPPPTFRLICVRPACSVQGRCFVDASSAVMDFRHKAVCPPPPPRRDSWGLPEPVGYNNEVASPYFPPSAPPPPPPRGGDFGLPDFSHGTRGLGDFLHNRVHEAETRVTRYSQQPAVHEATFSPTDRLQKPRLGAGAGAASGGSAAGGIVAELTGDGRFSSGHQLNAGAPAFHPRQHQTPQQTFEFEGVANPDDDDWVKNPDIRSYWTAPDAKQGSSVRQVPIPTASSGRYAGIAAELTSDGRLDPEPWQGNNYPSSVPVGKGFPKPGTPGNDWRREWRGEEPSRLKSAEEHWNTRSLNGSSKGKGKGKKGKDLCALLLAALKRTDICSDSCAMAVKNLDEVVDLLGENAEVSVVGRTAFMVAAERAIETDRGKDARRPSFAVHWLDSIIPRCVVLSDWMGAKTDTSRARIVAGFSDLQRRLSADTKEMSDKLGEAAAQFGFENWPEFHKVWTVVRTKFIDDIIGSLTDQKQMVNLGAGVDTRPYRLEGYSKLKASYEVDTPEEGLHPPVSVLVGVNAVKTAVFERLGATPFCPVVTVSADFRVAGELSGNLARSGFDDQVASVFLIEGLLDFLEDAATPFLCEVSKMAAPGSMAVINYAIGSPRPGTFTAAQLRELLEP